MSGLQTLKGEAVHPKGGTSIILCCRKKADFPHPLMYIEGA